MEYRPFKNCNEFIKHFRRIWRKARRFYEEYDFNLSIEMPSIWVINKDSGIREMIIGYGENIVLLPRANFTMQDLLNEYTFIDGSPCGVLETLSASVDTKIASTADRIKNLQALKDAANQEVDDEDAS